MMGMFIAAFGRMVVPAMQCGSFQTEDECKGGCQWMGKSCGMSKEGAVGLFKDNPMIGEVAYAQLLCSAQGPDTCEKTEGCKSAAGGTCEMAFEDMMMPMMAQCSSVMGPPPTACAFYAEGAKCAAFTDKATCVASKDPICVFEDGQCNVAETDAMLLQMALPYMETVSKLEESCKA